MQVTLPRAPLLEDLRLAERLLPLRSPEPLLEHFMLRAGARGCTLLAHDREVALWLPLAGEVQRPGTTLLPGRRVLALLRQVGAETVQVERNDDLVYLRAPGLTCQLLGGDPGRFPEPGPLPARAHALLPAGPLRQAIRRTFFAAAPGPAHYRDYLLEAVLWEVAPGRIRLVASDNRRLAVAEVPLLPPGGDDRPRRLLLSVKALALLGRLARDHEGPVRIFFGPPLAFFRVGRAVLAARLLRGRFPDWRAALPTGIRPVAELPVATLLAGVRQAAVLREPAHARLLLRLEPGRLLLESGQAGAGRVTVEQAVGYTGPALAVAFNPVYLLELVRSLEDDETTVGLELGPGGHTAVFQTAGGYRHVLVPLRQSMPLAPATSAPVFSRQT
jgi:DNA polymerase-3 subunit beta